MHDAKVRAHHERVTPLKRISRAGGDRRRRAVPRLAGLPIHDGAQMVIDGGATLGFAD